MEPGTYLPGRSIASSPLGVLYEGAHRETRGRVLLHHLVAPARADANLESRLQQLATLLGKQDPPAMLPLHAVERTPDGRISLALEYVHGETLATQLSSERTWSSDEIVRVCLQIAQTLERAHRLSIAHLTLTPHQILRPLDHASPKETIWLLGLGIAQTLGRSDASGWPSQDLPYAAPEQRTPGANVDERADVFALGVILSELQKKERTALGGLPAFLARMKAASPQERPTMAAVIEFLSERALEEKATLPRSQRSEPAAAKDPRIGMLVGNYRIRRKLGEGGMGVVYEAEHDKIGSRAAVKLLHGSAAKNEQYSQRFLNEARAVNIVRHRGLVQIFEFGKLPDGNLYYVMEYLEGRSARSFMDERAAALPEAEVLSIATQIAHALAAAHEKGIVHRDLKPDNILTLENPKRYFPRPSETAGK